MPTPTYNALQHLIIAERVCVYVRQIMAKGATNNPIDMLHSRMRHQSQMRDFKEKYHNLPFYRKPMAWFSSPKPDLELSILLEQRAEYKRWPNAFLGILACALLTEQSGIGNCAEQASVGFKYLCNRTNCEVFTIVAVGSDHVFLVLGVGKDDVEGDYSYKKVPNWPANAVICDPWYYEWFIVEKHWCHKMTCLLDAAEQGQLPYDRSDKRGFIRIEAAIQGPRRHT